MFVPIKLRREAPLTFVDELEKVYIDIISSFLLPGEWSDTFRHAALFLHELTQSIHHYHMCKRSFPTDDLKSFQGDSFMLTAASSDSFRNRIRLLLSLQVQSRTFE